MNNIFKKGLFYAFMAAGLLLAFSACQKEETMPATEGCSFTAVIPGGAPQTKAVNDDFGQGGSVNRCILEIYYKNELYKRIEKGVAGKQITFDNLNLIPSQEYDFVFWADCATEKTAGSTTTFEDKIYKTTNTGGLQNITENAPFAGNSDERDAFFHSETIKVTGAFTKTVTLGRPFGLLTLKTDDWAEIQTFPESLRPTSYSITFKEMPDTFNALTGEVGTTGEGSISYYYEGFAKTDGTISMDFLWATEDEASLADFSVTFYNGSGSGNEGLAELVTNENFKNIPLRRNYKTNVSGNLITKSGEIEVSITTDLADESYDEQIAEVEDVSQIQSALESGATNVVVKNAPSSEVSIIIPKSFAQADEEISITIPDSDQKITISEASDGSNNLPATVTLNASTTNTLVIDTPNTTVILKGNYGSVEAATAENTLVIPEGATVGSLAVKKGNVEIYGKVGNLTLAEGCKVKVYGVSEADTFMDASELAVEGKCGKILLMSDIATDDSFDFIAGELDLNGKRLSTNGSLDVKAGQSFTLRNGNVESKVANTSTSALSVSAGGTMILENVVLNTNGAGLFPEGDAAKLIVRNSSVNGWSYGVGTNASENHTLSIELENSTFTAAGAAVFMNIPGNMTVKNCTVTGNTQGMVVRGGTAKVYNSTITLNFNFDTYLDYYNKYENIDWGTGNSVQAAALTMGNKSQGYQYPTDVTLVNTQVRLTGPYASWFPCVYAYANQGEGLGVTFKYDAQCGFSKAPVYASENITVNGNFNPWDGVSVEAVAPNAAGEYEISTPVQLAWLAQQVNGGNEFVGLTVRLTEDIYLDGHEWTPIGNGYREDSTPLGKSFAGTFDGGNHTIHDLKISQTKGADYAIGLFGVVKDGTVKNLKFENADINVESSEMAAVAIGMLNGADALAENIEVLSGSVTAGRGNAGIVGRMTKSGTIRNCINRADITGLASGGNTGGIVGAAYYTATGETMTIDGCSNYGNVKGIYGVGGIVGLCAANVTGCTNEGKVYGAAASIGGIVAEQQNAGSVKNCENRGKVTNSSTAYGTGGIVGWIRYSGETANYPAKNIIEVSGNKNYAAIDGGNDAGGIVGTVYNYGEITGNENYAPSLDGAVFVAGIVGNAQFQETPAGMSESNMVNVKNNLSTTPLSAMTGGSCKDEFVYINEQDAVTEEGNTYSPAE